QLQKEEVMTAKEVRTYISEFTAHLEEELTASKEIDKLNIPRFMPELWSSFPFPEDKDFAVEVTTGVSRKTIDILWGHMNNLPEDKSFFSKVHKILSDRQKMFDKGKVDWAMGELLAYATLVNDGHPVRLSGQDSERGTFAHRHASFAQEDVRERYMPLRDSTNFEASFNAYNSPLSEYGVMGFEYGYALAAPNGLTIWEAQFGDFHNVAQVIIDQYISSAEEKWGLLNGLVLYLPHGYEGQGPEHSSARIERFLTISARNNMFVMNPTTPSNLFHALRRHLKREIRIPMIIFTPKSLLRHPRCISSLDDLENGHFEEVIDDNDVDIESVTRLVFCSGKIYYELLERKEELKARDVAIVRIEQIHPFPKEKMETIIAKYSSALLTLWVQEEPENMGAWTYINNNMQEHHIVPIARLASASPATGLAKLHTLGQQEIINKVFKPCHCNNKLPYCNLDCVEGKSRKEILKQHHYFANPTRFSI
ncbi:MAG: 2-oxoglutarate dehydrogenase E1 component, partial [Bacteroidales bacterium]|nr:2-oxoglutarate dehydrogenase E1 component [Bacteroidales bacterium]